MAIQATTHILITESQTKDVKWKKNPTRAQNHKWKEKNTKRREANALNKRNTLASAVHKSKISIHTHTHTWQEGKNGAKENPIKMNTKTKYTHLTLDVSFVAVCYVQFSKKKILWFSCVFDLKFISFEQNLLCNGFVQKRREQTDNPKSRRRKIKIRAQTHKHTHSL